MFSAASSSAAMTTAFADIGLGIAVAVAAVLVAWAGLTSLSFAIRKAKRYVTGGKF